MKDTTYVGTAIHQQELEKKTCRLKPKPSDFDLDGKVIKKFEIVDVIDDQTYLCRYTTKFEMTIPTQGNPLDRLNLKMLSYLYELQYGSAKLNIVASGEQKDE